MSYGGLWYQPQRLSLRPLVAYQRFNFLAPQPIHMLWVRLNETVLLNTKAYVKTDVFFTLLRLKSFFLSTPVISLIKL